jgi:cytochrome c biogenesis protein CcmG/thiol:disulfide interchange protein DsbE
MPPADGPTTLTAVRRLVFALIGLGLVAIIVIGLTQSKGGAGPNPNDIVSKAPSASAVSKAFAGSPPPLAALHRRANEIIPGGRAELQRQIKALKGYPIVVNVWGSWCGPCRLEFPSFQQQAVRYGRRVAFLGVDARDNRGAATKFLRDYPVTYPSVEDGDESVLGRLGGRGYPSTAFYDRRGKLVTLHQGLFRSDAELSDAIRRYAGVA